MLTNDEKATVKNGKAIIWRKHEPGDLPRCSRQQHILRGLRSGGERFVTSLCACPSFPFPILQRSRNR